jgi:hypothetical protein
VAEAVADPCNQQMHYYIIFFQKNSREKKAWFYDYIENEFGLLRR